MYRSSRSLRAPASYTLLMKLACLLLIVITIAAAFHTHNENKLDASRPCPVCVAIHCAIVVAAVIATTAQAFRPRQFCLADCEHISPLFVSDLFVRPPPVA